MIRKEPMPKPPKDLAALLFVHLGLLATAFAAAWFVHTQSPALPLMDEWDLLHEWVEADSPGRWIWKHHNEHRFPLAKGIWIGVLKATGYNFAAPQYLSFALLFSTALLLIWTARGLRGRSHPIDILFAALLLHFGHGFNLQMGYQVGFILFAYCAAGWLWCAGRLAQGGGAGWAVASTVYAALLVPCGGFGLIFTPVVAFWLVYLARRARTMGKPALRWYCFVLAAAIVGYSGWIALTMPKQAAPGTNPLEQPGDFLAGVVGYLASALGSWPVREGTEPWYIVAVAIPVAVAYAVGVRTLTLRLDELDPRRILFVAILLVLVGTVLVGAAAARARGGGLAERYTTASAIGAGALLLGLIGTVPLRLPKWADRTSWALAPALAAGLLYANYTPGLNLAFQMRDTVHELTRDIRAGDAPLYLAGRHGGTPGVLVGDHLHDDLLALRRSAIPPFGLIPEDPAYRTEALPELPRIDWKHPEADFWAGKTPPGIALPDPPPGALALRLRTTTIEYCGRQKLLLKWIDAETGAEGEYGVYPYFSKATNHVVFKLNGSPRRLRLVAGSAMEGIEIGTPEWLIAAPGR